MQTMTRSELSPDICAQLQEMEHACACHHLRKAARVVTQLYDAALAPAGIRSTQYPLLVSISSMEPVSMNDLAAHVVMDRTTLTRNLRPLLEAGLVTVKAGVDRRRREVELTAAGRRTLVYALGLWRQAQEQMREALGERRMGALLRELSDTVALVGGR